MALAILLGVVLGVEFRVCELGVELLQAPHRRDQIGGRDVGLLAEPEADLYFLQSSSRHASLPPGCWPAVRTGSSRRPSAASVRRGLHRPLSVRPRRKGEPSIPCPSVVSYFCK